MYGAHALTHDAHPMSNQFLEMGNDCLQAPAPRQETPGPASSTRLSCSLPLGSRFPTPNLAEVGTRLDVNPHHALSLLQLVTGADPNCVTCHAWPAETVPKGPPCTQVLFPSPPDLHLGTGNNTLSSGLGTVPLTKCLPCKNESLSLVPRTHSIKNMKGGRGGGGGSSIAEHNCNLRAGKAAMESPMAYRPVHLTSLERCRRKETLPQKNNIGDA